jgi:hypothetical protein
MITPGTGLTLNFFLKCNPIKCLAIIIAKIAIKKIIKKAFNFDVVFIFYLIPYSAQEPS